MTHLIDIGPRSQQMKFDRRDGQSLELGRIVGYFVRGTDFQINAHREGVDVSGGFPRVGEEGITVLGRFLAYAALHHIHLKSTAVGEPQTPLTEDMVRLLMANSETEA